MSEMLTKTTFFRMSEENFVFLCPENQQIFVGMSISEHPNQEKHFAFLEPQKSGKAHFSENHWIFAEFQQEFFDS